MEEREMNGAVPNVSDTPIVQWFPGHMAKTRRLIQGHLKLVDVVIELLDARVPASSANPLIRELVGEKPRLVALNKSDLADEAQTKAWLSYFRSQGLSALAIDSLSGAGQRRHWRSPRNGRCREQGRNSRAGILAVCAEGEGLEAIGKRLPGRNET